MSSLTKQQLTNELINHGVQLPPAGAKKDEYVRAYNEHVVKDKDKGSGDFSSDDEVDTPTRTHFLEIESMVVEPVSIERAEEVVNALTDKELYAVLTSLGQNIGPVVATTKSVYKHMLRSLLTGQKRNAEAEEVSTTTNGSGNGVAEVDVGNGHGEEYSDSDREVDTPKDTRTTRASNSEFEEYFLSYVDARQGGQRHSEVDSEKKKGRSSSRQSSTPRRESSPATSPTARSGTPTARSGTPTKFALPKLAEKEKDTPLPILFRKTVTGSESTPPATYRRTPTPNPELTRRNLAPRSLDLEPERPEPTVLKRKTIKRLEAGKPTNGNQIEVDNSPYAGSNVGIVVAVLGILALAMFGYIWYSLTRPTISQEEIEDMELDKILESL